MAIKGDFETIALAPNKGLLIQEGKFKLAVITIAKFTREPITARVRNLHICRKRVHVKPYPGEG